VDFGSLIFTAEQGDSTIKRAKSQKSHDSVLAIGCSVPSGTALFFVVYAALI
jgi:hypothetical protein